MISVKKVLLLSLSVLLLLGVSSYVTKEAVFVPKKKGTNSVYKKAQKTMWYTGTATEFRPITDLVHPERYFYTHRYHFLNFIKATTPYPTFRAAAIRDYSTGEFRDKLYDIIKAAYETGFGTENILINIPPQVNDFVGNSAELTDLFKDRIGTLLRNLNGRTEFLGIRFRVKYWETGNELDYFYQGKRHYAPGITDEQLYAYWKYLYEAIKKEIPDAVVLSNSFYYMGTKPHTNKRILTYINHKYPNGKHVYDYFDVFNFHYYHQDLSPKEIRDMVTNARQRINKNVWITELGCGNTDEEHAYRYPILNILASSLGVDRVLVYKMFNAVGTEGDDYSLITSFEYDDENTSLKNVEGEGFYAERFFCDICGQGSTRPVVSYSKGVNYAYWKSPNYGDVYAMWSDEGKIEIKIDCNKKDLAKIELYNYKGEAANVRSNNIVTVDKNIIYMTNCSKLKVVNN